MNVPTNGRQVLYFPHDGPTDRTLERKQPKAATICHVHGPECVNLAVLDQNGNTHSRSSIKLYPEGSFVSHEERILGGFAMWPERTVAVLRGDAVPKANRLDEKPEPGNRDEGTPPDLR